MNATYRKIITVLDWIALITKQTAIYLDLRWYIKERQNYTKLVSDKSTGIGKTYSLILLALKYGGIVITKDKFSKNLLFNDTMISKKVKIPAIKSYDELMAEKIEHYDVILFDTGFNDEQISNIYRKGIVCVGYRQVTDK